MQKQNRRHRRPFPSFGAAIRVVWRLQTRGMEPPNYRNNTAIQYFSHKKLADSKKSCKFAPDSHSLTPSCIHWTCPVKHSKRQSTPSRERLCRKIKAGIGRGQRESLHYVERRLLSACLLLFKRRTLEETL